MASSHGYRTKIEVLRDFLQAAKEPVPKTRIIGAANLNVVSFQRYLRLCQERELITATSGGYVVTSKAGPILEAIEGVIAKTGELDRAVQLLERSAQKHATVLGHNGNALRFISRQAWNEIVLSEPKGRADQPSGRHVLSLPQDPVPSSLLGPDSEVLALPARRGGRASIRRSRPSLPKVRGRLRSGTPRRRPGR